MARAQSTEPLTGGALQASILELIATGSPADEILSHTCRLIEQARPNTVCTALFLDPSSGLLGDVVAPSLPHTAHIALEGLPCAPDTGSCGTAAYTNTAVLVSDTRTDHRWQKDFLQQFAVRYGIRSCWSIPSRRPAAAGDGWRAAGVVTHRGEVVRARAVIGSTWEAPETPSG